MFADDIGRGLHTRSEHTSDTQTHKSTLEYRYVSMTPYMTCLSISPANSFHSVRCTKKTDGAKALFI